MEVSDRGTETMPPNPSDGNLSRASHPPPGTRPEKSLPRPELVSLPGVEFTEQQTKVSFMSGGEQRTLFVHKPANYDPNMPAPLIVVFNGYDSDPKGGAANMGKFTGLSRAGEKDGYVVAYLDGAGPDHTWGLYGSHNDPEFVTDALKYLKENYKINDKRIFAVAFSDGGTGMMAALPTLGGQIAAAAGDAIYTKGEEAALTAPTSALIIAGRDDMTTPPAGTAGMVSDGFKRLLGGEFIVGPEEMFWGIGHAVHGPHMEPTQHIVDYFRNADQTSAPPQTVHNGTMTTQTYANGRNGTEVEAITGDRREHGWGGSSWGDTSIDPSMLDNKGAPVRDTDIIIDFFNHHSKL